MERDDQDASGEAASRGRLKSHARIPWWGVALAVAAWFCLWFFTPGLLANGVGSWVTRDDSLSILIETAIALVLAVALVLVHRRYRRELFARSWQVWAYALPVVLAVALPFHYELSLPVGVYLFWMTVSVFWQDFLTFGLLQSYLGERLPRWGAVTATAVVFWLGHALYLPERFGASSILPGLAMLALGLIFASMRAWLGRLHLLLALHLAFYFVFA
ncbi:MAG: hypothetical protein ACTH31_04445 [Pseudoclavibacter sp.]